MIGHISEKYESAKHGPGIISDTEGDPGGKSYGIYQLSSKAGTLALYLNQSAFAKYFLSLDYYSPNFDIQWKHLAQVFPHEFRYDQYLYILRTHYLPASICAMELGYQTDDPGMIEAIFSISVQHARYRQILKDAAMNTDSVPLQLKKLYEVRGAYVVSLQLPDPIERAVLQRYALELPDVLVVHSER